MKLTPVMHRYIVHWGEMGSRWGIESLGGADPRASVPVAGGSACR